MISTFFALIALALYGAHSSSAAVISCKCGPEDSCWPSAAEWRALNSSVSGKLIADVQPAAPCYPGPLYDPKTCASLNVQLTNQDFVSDTAIGLSYPTGSCPPVDLEAGQKPGTCLIGDQPRYTVNATEPEDVAKGIVFAKKHNIRLVVRNTGHDILGRSTGYGSLQVWVKYIKKGLVFQERYRPSNGCAQQAWKGSAFAIGGGYVWSDVYGEAAKRNVIVVGGGTPSVSCLGGWMQGGGHGPAVHNHGLGADQVLEARVVLANGQIVTASACQNPDLFFAIRGGGPSTYGVVVSTVIKAHPTAKVAAQQLSFAPLSPTNVPAFMDALALIYASYPDLSDAGWSGYGSWATSPIPIVPNYSVGFTHTIAVFGKSAAEAEKSFSLVAAKLQKFKPSLFINTTYSTFPTYAAYYTAFSGIVGPVGSSAALGSRLLDRKALTSKPAVLKTTLQAIAGTPDQFSSSYIVFVGGGQVFEDAEDRYSGVNPAWRKTYVHNIVARGWAPGSDAATIAAVRKDITFTKVQALKTLAPDTGAYMNEGDAQDPDFLTDFYGSHLPKLEQVKRKYDPHRIFYCPTCVGSEAWKVAPSGKLCL